MELTRIYTASIRILRQPCNILHTRRLNIERLPMEMVCCAPYAHRHWLLRCWRLTQLATPEAPSVQSAL